MRNASLDATMEIHDFQVFFPASIARCDIPSAYAIASLASNNRPAPKVRRFLVTQAG